MVLSRLERLRKMTASDLEKLPDLLPEPVTAPELEMPTDEWDFTPKADAPAAPMIEQENRPARLAALPPGLESDTGSEADCHIEMTPIPEAEASAACKYGEHHKNCNFNEPLSASSEEEASAAGLTRGHLSPAGQSFCPILAVSKFPYRYIPKKDSESVAAKFFNVGQFWLRKWDL